MIRKIRNRLLGFIITFIVAMSTILGNFQTASAATTIGTAWLWPFVDINGNTKTTKTYTYHNPSWHNGTDVATGGSEVFIRVPIDAEIYDIMKGCNNYSGIDNGKCNVRGLCNPSNLGTCARYGAEKNASAGMCNDGFGNGVILKVTANSKSYYISFAHMEYISADIINLKRGAKVTAGTILGKCGATGYASGAHCHFEVANYNSSYWSASTFDPMSVEYSYAKANAITPNPPSSSDPFSNCGCTATYAGCYVINTSGGLNYNSGHNFTSKAGELAYGTVVYIEKSNTPCKTSGGQGHLKLNGKTYCIAMNLLREATDSEHPWDSGVVTKAATCIATGTKTYTCKSCGKTKTETIAKNASNHSGTNSGVVTKAATCKEAGVKTYSCTGCSATIRTESIPKLTTHTWNSGTVTKAATCTEAGVRTYTCTVCSTTKTESISPTGNHIWNSGVITKAATCTETGVKTYSCATCSATKTEDISVKGHTWNSGAVTKAATCSATGVKTYTCTVCNATKTEAIDKDSSNHSNWNYGEVTKVATCAEAGVRQYTCTGCSATRNETIAKLTTHTWDEGKTIAEPTFENEGVLRYTCLVCSTTEDKSIPSLTNPVKHMGDKIDLSGNIAYHYYLAIADSYVGKDNAYVLFTGNGIYKECHEYKTCTLDGQTVYEYTVEVNASQMTELISVQYIADGETFLDEIISVAYYAGVILENKQNKKDYAEAKDIVTALLNYGGYAQKYFGVNLGALANTGLFTDSASVDPVTDKSSFISQVDGIGGLDSIPSNSELNFLGASLVCKNITEMKFYYQMTNPISASELNSTYKISTMGNSNVKASVEGNMLVITACNIGACDLDDNNVISISGKNMSTITFMYSPINYIVTANKDNSVDYSLANLMRAMYYYNQAAKEYTAK